MRLPEGGALLGSKKNVKQNSGIDKHSFAQRGMLLVLAAGALATSAAGSGVEHAGKVAAVCWLGSVVYIWLWIGKDRRERFFRKCEAMATIMKNYLDGRQKSEVPAKKIDSRGPMKEGLPSLSLLPVPPAWARQAAEERTGTGYALRVNRAFRRCGLLKDEGERIEVISVQSGPAAARVTVSLPDGLRLTRLQHMTSDLASAFGVESLQVTPGMHAGSASLIIAYKNRLPVVLRTILESQEFEEFMGRSELPMVVGLNDIGEPIMIDLVSVRHLLVAGTTGSGKSWFINEVLVTLLLSRGPDVLSLVLIDPKRVELSQYRGFPHTITVATETAQAVGALESLVKEMECRYTIFEQAGVKNIQQYWQRTGDRSIGYIVGVIDELADLMSTARKEVEILIQRLTQLARAAGIHMIVATQRPSVDVITGVIKSNLPSRVVFQLISGPDYRTVLNVDQDLKLRGKGDGVALLEGHAGLVRFQSPGIGSDDNEADLAVSNIKDFWVNSGHKTNPVHIAESIVEAEEQRNTAGETGESSKLRAAPGPDMVKLPDFPEVFGELPGGESGEDGNPPESESEEIRKFKIIIAQAWQDAAEAEMDQITAPSIRSLRERMNIKQERVMELIDMLIREGWIQAPPVPKKPYLIVAGENTLKNYL